MFTNWKPNCGGALLVLALAVLCAGGAADLAQAEEGGWVDSHGLVWSQPHTWSDLQTYNWYEANVAAENYVVVEDGVVYDDWRLPTMDEMLAACDDKTIQNMLIANDPWGGLIGAFWSSDTFSAPKPKGYKGKWDRVRARCLRLDSIGSGWAPHSPEMYIYWATDAALTDYNLVLFVRDPEGRSTGP